MTKCELCENEEYRISQKSGKHVCISCYNLVEFGIGAPRIGKSMVYNKCTFCEEIFAGNAWRSVCSKCEIILTWKSSMNYLQAVNRVAELLKAGKLGPQLRNENYCRENFGSRAAQVIMDSIDNDKF